MEAFGVTIIVILRAFCAITIQSSANTKLEAIDTIINPMPSCFASKSPSMI